ncbi:MAG: phenylacetate-CoA oxygenase/reductase subunit PaaK [Sphingomonadales bacterium]|nr:phenylacetate-CoA oxygenase/reductase subunit PaaK [Sphingomonadales bacterium]
MSQFHALKIASITPETDDAVSIVFDVPTALQDTFRFTQGQHLVLRMTLNDAEVRRTYSICASPDDGVLKIAVKRFPGGVFSNFATDQLKPGDAIDVMPPVGHFFTPLDPSQAKTYVAFAIDEGITPILSLVKTTLAREPKSRFVLFYGNETVNNILFREEIEDLKNLYMARLSLFHILSREEQEVDILNGHLDGEKARALVQAFCPAEVIDEVFICCPQDVTNDIVSALGDLGVAKNHLHFELFHTAALAEKAPLPAKKETRENAAHVTLTLNGRKTEFDMPLDGTSVLAAARDRDIDAPFSCRDGVCGTCRAKLIEGKVDMAVNYALEEEDLAAGFVLTCQARPLTDKIVIDYDQA